MIDDDDDDGKLVECVSRPSAIQAEKKNLGEAQA
jgi:hypothetical protein